MRTDLSTVLHPGTWVLDRAHAAAVFSVRHMGISRVRGTFTGVDATLTVGDDLATTTLSAVVDMATVNTNNAMRDAHLRATDFFDVDAHPTMEFRSVTILESGADSYTVLGDLTINGTTRTQSLEVEFLGTEVFPPDGSTHAGITAKGSLSRKAFGIDFNVPLAAGGVVVGDKIDIELDIQLIPAGEAAAYHDKVLPAA
jgi:polyisoprenoid-binding protein YceI